MSADISNTARRRDGRGTALIVLDCMEGVAAHALDDETRPGFAGRMTSLVESANAAGVPVIRVDVEFRPGHLEVSDNNSYFGTVAEAGRLVADTQETSTMWELRDRLESTLRVTKRRIGALTDTELPQLLRGLGCDKLVLSGLITRGAILSTAIVGADLDYRVTVVEDCCHDPDASVHTVLIESVLPMRATVLACAAVMAEFAELERSGERFDGGAEHRS